MINIEDILRQLTANAEAMRALVESISDEQAQWKPNPETWSMTQVMEHVYNEERIDFRKHLKEMFSRPPQPWGEFRPEERIPVESCRQALNGFLVEREASLAWLKALGPVDWDTASQAVFSPDEVLVLRAGDVLFSWVAHDFLHIRQVNELLFAWNAKEGSPYAVQYAGRW
jgi:DinB superfamily